MSIAIQSGEQVGLIIPCDLFAEEIVIGTCIASPYGCELTSPFVRPYDFYKPTMRQLFEVAPDLPMGVEFDATFVDFDTFQDLLRKHPGREQHITVGPTLPDARIEAAAQITDIPIGQIATLVRDRPVMWDASRWASRIARAARRRRAMGFSADAFNSLGKGENVDFALRHLSNALAELQSEQAA